MRSRSKIIAVALLLAVAAYFLLNTPADKAPAEIAGRPKHKSLMLLPLNFQTPDPTAALKPLPGPKPIDENSPDQTDPDAQAIHDIAANISRLLSEYDFDGVANYTQPGTEEETKDTLERLLRGPDGPKRVQMLLIRFNTRRLLSPTQRTSSTFRTKPFIQRPLLRRSCNHSPQPSERPSPPSPLLLSKRTANGISSTRHLAILTTPPIIPHYRPSWA
jgi:hypothetical protein